MTAAVEFKNIKKSYGEKVALEDFSLSVAAGEFLTIIGSSGSGKTTVLKMVNGLIAPTAGDVFVQGENIRNKDMEIYAAPEHTYLFIDIHHIIYDGGSLGILQQALADAYSGGVLPAEDFSAYDYALFYQEWKASAGFAEAETYFNQLVEGAESVLYPVSQELSGTAGGSGRISLSMPGEAVQEFCRKQGVTANSFFIAMEIYAAPEHTYLFIDIHHTIYDGGSMGILQRGLAAACGGAELAPEVFSAYDYALGYQEWKESAACRDAEAYFNGLVKGAESLLYPVSSEADGCSGSKTVSTVLPKGSIQRLCRDQGITVNSFFLAALTRVLGRITREEKLLITTISNGRASAKMADTMISSRCWMGWGSLKKIKNGGL